MTGNRHPKVALHYHPTGRRDPVIARKGLRPDRKLTKKNATSSHKISKSFLFSETQFWHLAMLCNSCIPHLTAIKLTNQSVTIGLCKIETGHTQLSLIFCMK
jgi:hypothetical protein